MASELGKHLDTQLRAHVPALMKAHGFKAKRSPRSWVRDVSDCHQVVAITVDGRSAPDGYLVIAVEAGVSYDGDRGVFVVGGEAIRWHVGNLSEFLNTAEWRFDERAVNEDYGGGIARYIERNVLPALDRFVDPRALRDHLMLQGNRLWDVIDLSLKVGDRATARTFVAASVQFFVLRLKANPAYVTAKLIAGLIALADDLDVAIDDQARSVLLAAPQY